jgi:hypothetical protein
MEKIYTFLIVHGRSATLEVTALSLANSNKGNGPLFRASIFDEENERYLLLLSPRTVRCLAALISIENEDVLRLD